uniref:AIG1-type G domain-containing protein n=1 Tax=Cyprinus carpio TaxID=7962 RepID=A0A8C1ZJL7_CYPCA
MQIYERCSAFDRGFKAADSTVGSCLCESKPEIKIILAGKTGVGKSSTGNTILKKQIFQSDSSPNSKTKYSTTGNGMVYNRRITVIDTPGILSTSDDEEYVKKQLIRALVGCAPGPFVVVFVLKVERYTSQEREIETKIWEYLKGINFKQTLLLFTHGEQLEGQTIEEFVKKSPRLQEYVEKCEGRCHVIDSKYWKNSLWGYKSNRFQVKNLLDAIDKMRKENNCYTNELLLILDEEIKNEIELTDPNLFAGVATGTLVGALMGIATPVAALVSMVKGVKNISTTAEEAEKETLLELDKATAGETKITAAAVLGATEGRSLEFLSSEQNDK